MRKQQITVVFLLFALALMTLSGCRHTPDETQVREAIAAVADAAEHGSPGGVIKRLTDDFDGNAGDLDRNALAGLLRLTVLRGDHLHVTTGPITIEHHGDRMVATLSLTLASGSHLLPDQLGIYRVESAWRRDDGQWRCYAAHWTEPGA